MKEKYVYCNVKIKMPAPSYNVDWKRRQDEMNKARAILVENFYLTINKVVALGGVVCVNKYHLDYENRLIDQNLLVKVPESVVPELAECPFIDTCSPSQAPQEDVNF